MKQNAEETTVISMPASNLLLLKQVANGKGIHTFEKDVHYKNVQKIITAITGHEFTGKEKLCFFVGMAKFCVAVLEDKVPFRKVLSSKTLHVNYFRKPLKIYA